MKVVHGNLADANVKLSRAGRSDEDQTTVHDLVWQIDGMQRNGHEFTSADMEALRHISGIFIEDKSESADSKDVAKTWEMINNFIDNGLGLSDSDTVAESSQMNDHGPTQYHGNAEIYQQVQNDHAHLDEMAVPVQRAEHGPTYPREVFEQYHSWSENDATGAHQQAEHEHDSMPGVEDELMSPNIPIWLLSLIWH